MAKTKTIELVVAGSGEIKDLEVGPGTKVREVLQASGLRDYHQVSIGADQPFLRPDDDVYDNVPDGGKLWATTPAVAGR
jgi:hypothetical protein